MEKIIEQMQELWNGNLPTNSEVINTVEESLNFFFPRDYIKFIEWSNGGEGQLKNGYLYLWKIEDIKQLNIDYGIQEFLSDDCIAIGTDGGDKCYGFDFSSNGRLFESPLGDLDYTEIKYPANDFLDFITYLTA